MTTELRGLDWLHQQFERLIELDDDQRTEALAAIEREDAAAARKLRNLLDADDEYQHGGEDAPEPVLPLWTARLPEIPGYRLIELAGSGGMGQVYKAVREDDTQQVVRAVKVLRQADAHPLARARFEDECKVLAALDHRGIARYIASGISESGQPYVVMEYIDGEPIDAWCDSQQASLRRRVELIRELLAAVQHAHQRLIVHRDIKAGNVLVDANGRLSLVDFGIAKQLSAEPGLESTATAARFLSLLSAAPEQLTGDPVSTATDVYAVGLLLYRLLCGQDPFSNGSNLSPLEFQRRVIQIPPPSPTSRVSEDDLATAQARGYTTTRDLQRDLRGDLANVVLRCLRKAPTERYASVGALDRDLQNVLEGLPISERESEPAYRLRKFVSRHRGKVAAVTAAVVLLCTALVTALYQRASALRERDRAEAVIGVLKDAFAAANPLSTGGGETRVREVLNAAAPMLDDLRATQPDVFVELAATMAEVELSAGRASAAMLLTGQALELLEAQLDPDARLLARLQRLDARARLDAGQLDGLQSLIDRIDTPDLHAEIELFLLRGRFAYLQNEVDRAIGLLARAEDRVTALPADDPLALQVDLHLAQAYRLSERDQEAAAQLDEALARLLALNDRDHPKVLLVRMRQLEFAQRTQPVEESLEAATALLGEVDRVFGENSEPAARLAGLLAMLQSRAKRPDDAIASFRRSWQAWEASTSAGHPNALRALFNLTYMMGLGDYPDDEVMALYRRLFDDSRGGGELSPVIISYWRISQVEFLQKRGRCSDALHLAGRHFSDANELDLNSPTQALLRKTLDAAGQSCRCATTDADAHCASLLPVVQALETLTEPA